MGFLRHISMSGESRARFKNFIANVVMAAIIYEADNDFFLGKNHH